MADQKSCREPGCGHPVPLSAEHCPHCGRPRWFPNVDLADLPEERAALDNRFERALRNAGQRDARERVTAFMDVAELAKPVMAVSFSRAREIARSDNKLVETFYMRGASDLERGSHVLRGPKWDGIRPAAETALFGDDAKKQIHFAALSPDERGLTRYGACSLSLRPELIAHRTSLLEQNMLVFFKEKCENFWRDERIPAGFRASWERRARLAVVKLADQIDAGTEDHEFPSILLKSGDGDGNDEFIELHIYGNMTVRTIEAVVLTQAVPGESRARLRAFQHDLNRFGCRWVNDSTTRS